MEATFTPVIQARGFCPWLLLASEEVSNTSHPTRMGTVSYPSPSCLQQHEAEPPFQPQEHPGAPDPVAK